MVHNLLIEHLLRDHIEVGVVDQAALAILLVWIIIELLWVIAELLFRELAALWTRHVGR